MHIFRWTHERDGPSLVPVVVCCDRRRGGEHGPRGRTCSNNRHHGKPTQSVFQHLAAEAPHTKDSACYRSEVVTLEDIPLYNEDLDQEPEIPSVVTFKKIIAEREGVLIITPEYNHGVPDVLKNALDWASRPVFESCFKNKPVSIISSSKAFTGGVRAQYQLREALISMHAHLVMGPEVVVGGVHAALAEDVYQDESGLSFMLRSLDGLRKDILSHSVACA